MIVIFTRDNTFLIYIRLIALFNLIENNYLSEIKYGNNMHVYLYLFQSTFDGFVIHFKLCN